MDYLWIKSLHIIAVICWMAGLFYLPRLFIYHTQAEIGSDKSETFKVMERKLLKYIMNPAMVASWVFGIWMLVENPALMTGGWFHVKASAVMFLTIYHHLLGSFRKKFEQDKNVQSEKFYRIFNEVPTILMIVIVIMVVVKPWS